MIELVMMTPEELSVLYKLFRSNHQIIDLKVERDGSDIVAMLHLRNNDTLYFPNIPFARQVSIKESTDGR